MSNTQNILIVDDDEDISSMLGRYLEQYGYRAFHAAHGEFMHQMLSFHEFALVVMDVMLPGKDGLTLTRELRQRCNVPVIMLTACDNPYDRVVGLENGADDYLGKPFEPRELVARIRAVLRSHVSVVAKPAEGAWLQVFDGWWVDADHRCLHAPDGLLVPLSQAEYRLLEAFLETPGRLISREQLLQRMHGPFTLVAERNVDLLVSRLRQKLARAQEAPDAIRTVRGKGYIFQSPTPHGRFHPPLTSPPQWRQTTQQ